MPGLGLLAGAGRLLGIGGAAGAGAAAGGFLGNLGAEVLAPVARDLLLGKQEPAPQQVPSGVTGAVGGPTSSAGGINAASRVFAPTATAPQVDPTPTLKEMSTKLDGVIVGLSKVEGRITQQTQQQTETAKAAERSARETSLEGASTATPGGSAGSAMGMIQGAGLVGLVGAGVAGAAAAVGSLASSVIGSGEPASGSPSSATYVPPRRDSEDTTSVSGRNGNQWSDVVLGGRFTSGRGMRNGKFHSGVDIAAPAGTPVKAVAAGTCTRVSNDTRPYRGYGLIVIIDHGDGWQTVYAHLSAHSVRVGQRVAIGDQIGLVGNTGRSRGAHLHLILQTSGFTVPVENNTRDPSSLLARAREAARDGGERVESESLLQRGTRAVGEAVDSLIERGRELFTDSPAESSAQPQIRPASYTANEGQPEMQQASYAPELTTAPAPTGDFTQPRLFASYTPSSELTPTNEGMVQPRLQFANYTTSPGSSLPATPIAASTVIERAPTPSITQPRYPTVTLDPVPTAANDNPREMANYLRRQLTKIKTANPSQHGELVRAMLNRVKGPLIALESRLVRGGRLRLVLSAGMALTIAGLVGFTYMDSFNINSFERQFNEILDALGVASSSTETAPAPAPVRPAPAPAPAPDNVPAPAPVPPVPPTPETRGAPVPVPVPPPGGQPAPESIRTPAPAPGVEVPPPPPPPPPSEPPPTPPELPYIPFTLPTPTDRVGRGPPELQRRWGSSPGLTFKQREVDLTRATGVSRGSGILGLGEERPLTGRIADPQIVEKPFLIPSRGTPVPQQMDIPLAPQPSEDTVITPVQNNVAPSTNAVDSLSREMSRRQIAVPDRGTADGYTPPRSQAPTPSDVSRNNSGLLGVSDIPAMSAYNIVKEYQLYFLGVAAQSNSF